MQAWYPAQFEREMGCTEAELLQWLPGAVGSRPFVATPGRATIALDAGELAIEWRVLPPRRIALLQMPRLAIVFRFDAVDAGARQVFMRHFDLYTQRGGG
jgi:hypothetical protein